MAELPSSLIQDGVSGVNNDTVSLFEELYYFFCSEKFSSKIIYNQNYRITNIFINVLD